MLKQNASVQFSRVWHGSVKQNVFNNCVSEHVAQEPDLFRKMYGKLPGEVAILLGSLRRKRRSVARDVGPI